MTLSAAGAMPVPPGWTSEQSVGLAVNWPTALAALQLGRLAAGETVLIHAAAGATGRALLTLARHRGAITIASASPSKHALPSSIAGPYTGPSRPPIPAVPAEQAWFEPLPDAWVTPAEDDPSVALVARESLRLALIASLQCLPARQRAIFILREVLSFSAAEAAQILGMSVVAIKSGLQRARAQLEQSPPDREQLLAPTDERARQLLQGYIAAFERADARALVDVLRAGATLEATPFTDWQSGRVRCIELLETYVLRARGEWRMLPTRANGQPAAAVYQRDDRGAMRGSGIVVLNVTASGVARVTAFHHEPAAVGRFGFPDELSDDA